jgi:hypothetical protein
MRKAGRHRPTEVSGQDFRRLGRATVYETEGHRFESCRARSSLAGNPLQTGYSRDASAARMMSAMTRQIDRQATKSHRADHRAVPVLEPVWALQRVRASRGAFAKAADPLSERPVGPPPLSPRSHRSARKADSHPPPLAQSVDREAGASRSTGAAGRCPAGRR